MGARALRCAMARAVSSALAGAPAAGAPVASTDDATKWPPSLQPCCWQAGQHQRRAASARALLFIAWRFGAR